MDAPSPESGQSKSRKQQKYLLFLRRRSLVLIAILLTAASALMTYFMVNAPNSRIIVLKDRSATLESKIRDSWFDATQINRDADMTVLIFLLNQSEDQESQNLKLHYLSRLGLNTEKSVSVSDILQKAQSSRNMKIDQINSIYAEHVGLEEQINAMEEKILFFASLAFFLQILGLILIVVTRDMPDGT